MLWSEATTALHRLAAEGSLALAQIEDVALVTGDARLVRGAGSRLPYVLPLADEANRLT